MRTWKWAGRRGTNWQKYMEQGRIPGQRLLSSPQTGHSKRHLAFGPQPLEAPAQLAPDLEEELRVLPYPSYDTVMVVGGLARGAFEGRNAGGFNLEIVQWLL